VSAAAFIHPLADVQTAKIGAGSRVWQFCVVLPGARIGRDCNVNAQCLIENDVVIGDRVTLKSGVQLWNGLRVEDDVFIGPNASFGNDRYPRSKRPPNAFTPTLLRRGASIGANATVLCGLVIGEGMHLLTVMLVNKIFDGFYRGVYRFSAK